LPDSLELVPLPSKSGTENTKSKLDALAAGTEITVVPGVFSPIVAKLAQRIGFNALYFSGAAYSSLQALPDLGVTTLTEVCEAVRMITATVTVPLIVDVDTGFGEAVNVLRTIREMRRAGAAAVQIEDQVMPKKCGHLDGKEVVDIDEMVKKLITAKEAADHSLSVIARTDARAVEGIDATISRAKVYGRAGADIIFPEALQSREEFVEFREKVSTPLLANMTEFGKTPYLTAREFGDMGYNFVIFPVTSLRVMMRGVEESLQELMQKGTQRGMLDRMMTRKEIYKLIDYDRYGELDRKTLTKARRLMKSRSP
jgi:methylisocitrate lyase